ncbi:hypothetical protein [Clostridium tarantellae]|uniref:Class I SAM-dependent methyltransferase n=1 Tax=Clostridium tarantellae TaxID=39493 RepID=A0A6I1MRB3_9CLOT|nr:hypothetical protein [Clostridium tarantellae]MPQ42829.1 hypothetical protein [Clostridium tarantellae]
MENILSLDMSNICFKGSTLDVGNDNYGVIYNILKNYSDEISVDYYEDNLEENYKYDNGVMFFSLSQISSNLEKEKIIEEIWYNLKFGGILYIWDREKKQKEIAKDKINVLLPNGRKKEFNFNNLSPFIDFTENTLEKVLEKYFEIQETKVCDKIIYIKAIRRGSIKDENTINSSKFKIYSQQFSSEIFKSIYKGLKFPRRH